MIVESRQNPICHVPKMSFGNMPLDGGNLLLSDDDKNNILQSNPESEKFIKPLISAKEFLNKGKRWCLWLVDANPEELKAMPEVMDRIEKVRQFRLLSKRPATIKNATMPMLFGEIRDFGDSFVVVPRVSSENRKYIPMGFFGKESVVSDTCMAIPNATLYHFGILESEMHMAWVRHVCGRLKSDFRYSKDIVYNNFPWPENPSEEKVKAVESAAQEVLDVRAKYPDSSLADLYDPLTMPADLVKAHQNLDRAVDAAYGKRTFNSSTERMEFLFGLYEGYINKPKKDKL